MGKKLIIVRHAKSSWEYNIADHERPLSDRGIEDAHKISAECINKLNPDIIISSHAKRAINTATIFISNLIIDKNKVLINHDLYDFSGENLIKVIKSLDDTFNEVMVFGHNNAITFFVNKYGDSYIDNVPTCGLVALEFNIYNWSELKKGTTTKIMFPRDFKN